MKNISIKKETASELPILNKISVRSKMYWNYPIAWMEKWSDGMMLHEKDLEEQEVYTLMLSKEVIGFCSIQELENDYEIINLWVLPSYIGKGYGKYLLNKTMEKVVKEEKNIIVEADPNAESFYAKQGFVTFGQKESYPKGRFLPIMKKTKK